MCDRFEHKAANYYYLYDIKWICLYEERCFRGIRAQGNKAMTRDMLYKCNARGIRAETRYTFTPGQAPPENDQGGRGTKALTRGAKVIPVDSDSGRKGKLAKSTPALTRGNQGNGHGKLRQWHRALRHLRNALDACSWCLHYLSDPKSKTRFMFIGTTNGKHIDLNQKFEYKETDTVYVQWAGYIIRQHVMPF